MSGIVQVGGVALASHDEGTDKVSLDSGTVFPAGHVVQVQSITFTDAASTGSASETFVKINGSTQGDFEKAITISAGNHVLVLYDVAYNMDGASQRAHFRLVRTSTNLKVGDAASSRVRATFGGGGPYDRKQMLQVAGSYLDVSPATGVNTYYMSYCVDASGSTLRINHAGTESDSVEYARAASTLTLMEVQV